MTKNEFIEKVTPLFIEHGFRTFTVDEIAKEFGMSKKTVYNMFENKKEIISLSFDFVLKKFFGFFNHAEKTSQNPVEAFFTLFCLVHAYFPYDKQRMNIREMGYYYKEMYAQKMQQAQKVAENLFTAFCESGRKHNVVREDFDIPSQAHLFSVFYIELVNSSFQSKAEKYSKTVMDNVEISIRGVLNLKGVEYFDTAKKQSLKTDYNEMIETHCL